MAHYFLLTRPTSQNALLAEEVKRLGYTPISTPVIEIIPVEFSPPTEGITGLIITSQNAIDAIKEHILPTIKDVWIVGGASSDLMKPLLPEASIHTFSEAKELMQAFKKAKVEGHIWYPHGNIISHAPPKGANILSQVVYRSIEASSLSNKAKEVLSNPCCKWGVALFSPRSAQIFCKLAKAAKPKGNFYCLSEAVAAEVSLGYNILYTAAKPNLASLLEIIPPYKSSMHKRRKFLLLITAALIALALWLLPSSAKHEPSQQSEPSTTVNVPTITLPAPITEEKAEEKPLSLPAEPAELLSISHPALASQLVSSWEALIQENTAIWPRKGQRGSNLLEKIIVIRHYPSSAHELSNKLLHRLADHDWQSALHDSQEIAELFPRLAEPIANWQTQLQKNIKASQ